MPVINSVIGFILIITPLIFVHELGHYLMARYAKVSVETFSIGFGPELFGFNDRNGTRWRLSIIPLGGYVKMIDEHNYLHHDNNLNSASLIWRIAIVSCGPLANVLLTIFILMSVNWHYGAYDPTDYLEQGIGMVIDNSAASEAGLQKGDIITAINDQPILTFVDIENVMRNASNDMMILHYLRNGKNYKSFIIPKLITDRFGKEHFVLGISSPELVKKPTPIYKAFKIALNQTKFISLEIIYNIGIFISDLTNYNQFSGPIKIAQYSGENFSKGLESFLLFAAILSINLAIINLLPIPGLDGGHFMLILIESIIRRKPSDLIISIVNGSGIILILTFVIIITIKDIWGLALLIFNHN